MAVDEHFGADDHDWCMSKTLVRSTWKHHEKPALLVFSMGLLFALFNDAVSISDYIQLNERIIVELKIIAKFLIDVLCQSSTAGLPNLWHACPKWHVEIFPWHAEFTAVPTFFISFARPASLYCEEHVCMCVCVCVCMYVCMYSYTSANELPC